MCWHRRYADRYQLAAEPRDQLAFADLGHVRADLVAGLLEQVLQAEEGELCVRAS
jgi:hypothetical protein